MVYHKATVVPAEGGLNSGILLDFLSRGDELQPPGVASGALKSLLQALGFPYFALLRKARPDAEIPDCVLAGDVPEQWDRTYEKKNYILVDPKVRYLRNSRCAFRWRDALEAFRGDPYHTKMQRMMNEAARVGLEDGYVFPVHCCRGLIGYLSVGGPPVELSSLELALLDTVAKKAFWMLLEASAPEIAAALTAPVNVQLTRREMEALGYLADGMTSNEISQVLSISSNTVDWYMNGIQSKLRAKNRHHAVAIAFRSGLIC